MQFWLDFGPVLVKMHACQHKKEESLYSSPLFYVSLSCITAEQNSSRCWE